MVEVFDGTNTTWFQGAGDNLIFKTGFRKYEVVWVPKYGDSTFTSYISEVCKATVSFAQYPASISNTVTLDILTPSGYGTIWTPCRSMGYIYGSDTITLPVVDFANGHSASSMATSKLLAFSRTFTPSSSVATWITDILGTIKFYVTKASFIFSNIGNFWGINGTILGAVGVKDTSAIAQEVSILFKKSPSTGWIPFQTGGNNFIQEKVELIWDNGIWIGFITAAHGANSRHIRWYDFYDRGNCTPSGCVFSSDPMYDPCTNSIIWMEWGENSDDKKRIWKAAVSDLYGSTLDVDITPAVGSSMVPDGLGHNFDMYVTNRFDHRLFTTESQTLIVMAAYNLIYNYSGGRVLLANWNGSTVDNWRFLATSGLGAKIFHAGTSKAIDIATTLPTYCPLYLIAEQED